MLNIVVLLSLLLLPYWALLPFGVSEAVRGKAGLALVFLFTGVGHFVKASEMLAMLPPWVPMRVPIIYVSGVFELALAAALFIPGWGRTVGIVICLFLLAIFPSNVYAAFARVDFGGHAEGPMYLSIRLPLQLMLIGWCYWFTLRGGGS